LNEEFSRAKIIRLSVMFLN